MKHSKESGFAERRDAAAEAKKQLLKKFAAAPKPDDAQMQAKLAEKAAIAAAREARRAERDRLKLEEQERRQAEAAAAAQAAADAARANAPPVLSEAERKAERDRRYAARKARKR
jgi:hypothetical protein